MTAILLPDEGWHEAGVKTAANGLAADAKGEVVFASASGLGRVAADGQVAVVRDKTPGLGTVALGSEGKTYAVDASRHRVVSFDANGREAVVADGIDAHGLAVTHGGRLYVTEPKQKKVWLVEGPGKKRAVDTGIAEPTAIALTPDQSLLLVADAQGIFVYSFQIQADGSLAQKQPYFHLHLVEGDTGTGASAMVVDANGYLYVTTALGIQVCDQAGRVNGIVSRPRGGAPGALSFGGPELDELYVAVGDTVYHRKTRAHGVRSFEAPVKPAAPRL
jgi:sugar lactone lactonase YvrE